MINVMIGVPHGGWLCPGLPISLLHATKRDDLKFAYKDAGGSLLCLNFNKLLVAARKLKREQGLDFFVMHHSDVFPAEGWLDWLMAERERVEADVLSVVIALKDSRGLTTTGVAEPGQTNVRRFTAHEVRGFPQTFNAASVGEPEKHLMINTGLWIADCRKPWFDKFSFATMDWISDKDGQVSYGCLSEDWLWSHWLAENNTLGEKRADKGGQPIRVFATSGVKLQHRGIADWSIHDPQWGRWQTDLGDEVRVTAESAENAEKT